MTPFEILAKCRTDEDIEADVIAGTQKPLRSKEELRAMCGEFRLFSVIPIRIKSPIEYTITNHGRTECAESQKT